MAAEDQVAADYQRRGFEIRQKRWRGRGGEIDLIAKGQHGYVFIEVKKSGSFARAAQRITQHQLRRISNAATEFLGTTPKGLDTNARIDVALVNDAGDIEIIENAFGH